MFKSKEHESIQGKVVVIPISSVCVRLCIYVGELCIKNKLPHFMKEARRLDNKTNHNNKRLVKPPSSCSFGALCEASSATVLSV
mmetsp:Transcript_5812/g.10151  ORF Transcript_5812/g.10151 Transcript_5812/m.10151 type:complete len:84 (-) Transcript_5812:307-558(-)